LILSNNMVYLDSDVHQFIMNAQLFLEPKNGSWTGWSAWFSGRRARRNDAEWSFHSKKLQRRHAPRKPCNPPRSELTKQVNRQILTKQL